MAVETFSDPNYSMIVSIHGISGLIIFITGILQLLLKKGGKAHSFLGYIYLISWVSILLTGIYIGYPIIVAIVLMGFYLALTGIRAAVLKGKQIVLFDKIILITAVIIVLFMFIKSILLFVEQNYTLAIIASIFTCLYSIIITNDVLHFGFNKKIYTNKYGDKGWYINHIIRLEASFITAISAFVAVQDVFGNMILNFTLPGVIGGVLIVISKKYFVKKLNLG